MLLPLNPRGSAQIPSVGIRNDPDSVDFQIAQAGWIGENNPGHYLDLLVTDAGNEPHVCTEAPGRQRLVGTLAAGKTAERRARDCFTG